MYTASKYPASSRKLRRVTDVETPPAAPSPAAPKSGNFWKELPILLGAAVVVAILVRSFVLQTFYVPSGSMEHTLNQNDRVLVNKLVYDFRDPHRGEVIVFTSPVDWRDQPNEKDFVKRVIGTPGDRVVCCDTNGRITINGVAITEDYLDTDNGPNAPASPNKFAITVPARRLWVMGDNRVDSADSRYHYQQSSDIMDSTIPISSVIGRAFVLFWPFSRGDWLSVPETFSHVPDPGR
jgi:signal peptidase I